MKKIILSIFLLQLITSMLAMELPTVEQPSLYDKMKEARVHWYEDCRPLLRDLACVHNSGEYWLTLFKKFSEKDRTVQETKRWAFFCSWMSWYKTTLKKIIAFTCYTETRGDEHRLPIRKLLELSTHEDFYCLIKFLLQMGADPNKRADSRPAIFLVKELHMAKLLLKYDANIHATLPGLLYRCLTTDRSADLLEFYLQKNADRNIKLMISQSLHILAKSDHKDETIIEKAKLLLNYGALINEINSDEMTPLDVINRSIRSSDGPEGQHPKEKLAIFLRENGAKPYVILQALERGERRLKKRD